MGLTQCKWPRREVWRLIPRSPAQRECTQWTSASVPHPTPPLHELIRLDVAAHPERTPSEHEAAARAIAGRTYVEDLRRISPAANAALSLELEAEGLGL